MFGEQCVLRPHRQASLWGFNQKYSEQDLPVKRARKDQIIADEIEGKIQSGELQPGDSLASVKSLCSRYQAGQKTVEAALRTLVNRGLIEVRPRSGCYVLELPSSTVGETQDSIHAEPRRGEATAPATAYDSTGVTVSGVADQSPGPQRQDLLDVLLGSAPSTATNLLRVYISDTRPEAVAAWDEALSSFHEARVELVDYRAGALDSLMDQQAVDVVHATPGKLAQVGRERFVAVDEFGPMSQQWWEWTLPQVRAYRRARTSLLGVPFSITAPYLFVNLDLAEQVGAPTSPRDPEQMLRAAIDHHDALAKEEAVGLDVAAPVDLMLMFGAIELERDRLVKIVPEPALRLLRMLSGAKLPAVSHNDTVSRFKAGRVMYLPHMCFEVPDLLQNADFRWHAVLRPRPRTREAPFMAWMLMLAINRETQRSDLTAELIRHLASPEVQRIFATRHGHLPVTRDVLEHLPTSDDHLSADTVQTVLDQIHFWPEPTFQRASNHLNLGPDRNALLSGSLTPEEALQRLRFHLRFVNP